jgi:serine/threonine protein kinase
MIRFKSEIARGSCAKILDIDVDIDCSEQNNNHNNNKYVSVKWLELPFSKKKYVAKVGPLELIEIELLKKIKSKNLTSMIHILGIQDDFLLGAFTFIIFEKAESDLLTSRHSRDTLMETYRAWSLKVLADLKSLNFAFLDWKPENILVFSTSTSDSSCCLRLADFGSAKQLNVSVENKHDINMRYSSPFVSHCYDTICPTVLDDEIGLIYVYLWLANYNAPWFYLNPVDLTKKEELAFLILQLKTRQKFHKIDDMFLPDKWMRETIAAVYTYYSFY